MGMAGVNDGHDLGVDRIMVTAGTHGMVDAGIIVMGASDFLGAGYILNAHEILGLVGPTHSTWHQLKQLEKEIKYIGGTVFVMAASCGRGGRRTTSLGTAGWITTC